MSDKQKIHFDIGDIIFDKATKDVGILIYRYKLFDDEYSSDINGEITVWDVYWNSPGPFLLKDDTNFHKYSEIGLEFLIQSGIFIHYKCN